MTQILGGCLWEACLHPSKIVIYWGTEDLIPVVIMDSHLCKRRFGIPGVSSQHNTVGRKV